ncbi:extracellular Cu/Zn superoxide dismutase [Powellomyces hirtus]|nr:extracellular Cu/Zn superoxide dismutase [Powellomyces hirtus]
MFKSLVLAALCSVAVAGKCKPDTPATTITGVASLTPDVTFGANVTGTVKMVQTGSAPAVIKVKLAGLTPGLHGFHIHEFGNIFPDCTAAGGHYNPFNKTHGAPDAATRHVGDLGNVEARADGTVDVEITDTMVHLSGSTSVIGRSFVIHAGVDDLGLGGHPLSNSTGNAGKRAACGVIGIGKN